jgi:hypothetical protein
MCSYIKENEFINLISETNEIYMNSGANSRSSKKVDKLHNYFKNELESILENPDYSVRLEQQIKYHNDSGQKKCDIVLYYKNIPIVIFPLKYIMTGYNKNKNNYWENMVGETTLLKYSNPNINIIPINIILNKIPDRDGTGTIKKFEEITYDKSYKKYESLIDMKLCGDTISYILDVEHKCNVGEKYNKCPNIIGFNKNTPFRSLNDIISPFINQ